MSHCSRHDVPMLPGALGCPACAAEPHTLVCAWSHTHEGEKHISELLRQLVEEIADEQAARSKGASVRGRKAGTK